MYKQPGHPQDDGFDVCSGCGVEAFNLFKGINNTMYCPYCKGYSCKCMYCGLYEYMAHAPADKDNYICSSCEAEDRKDIPPAVIQLSMTNYIIMLRELFPTPRLDAHAASDWFRKQYNLRTDEDVLSMLKLIKGDSQASTMHMIKNIHQAWHDEQLLNMLLTEQKKYALTLYKEKKKPDIKTATACHEALFGDKTAVILSATIDNLSHFVSK